MADRPLRPYYENEKWTKKLEGRSANDLLKAWCQGLTGYPLVDAAMRQLWLLGWMPNYMRHIVAGFLIEFLHLDWRLGERWFHDTLVDADLAINAYMWQNGAHKWLFTSGSSHVLCLLQSYPCNACRWAQRARPVELCDASDIRS
jgi:deoxyribodipyrimidine photolyase